MFRNYLSSVCSFELNDVQILNLKVWHSKEDIIIVVQENSWKEIIVENEIDQVEEKKKVCQAYLGKKQRG